MDISNELLAAYAEGNVTKEERNQVRQYLAEHPREIESVMIMMDEDYELTMGDKGGILNQDDVPAASVPQMAAKVLSQSLIPGICCSAASFAPGRMLEFKVKQQLKIKQRESFDKRLDALMDDLDI